MSGQTLQRYILPLAAGVQAVFTSSGLSNYRHADWLGTSRLSLDTSGNLYVARSYAPFGEAYNGATGSAGLGANDRSFTGQTQDVIAGPTGIYDFLVEELVGQANLKNGLSLKSDRLDSDIRCLRLSAMRNGNIDCADCKPVALAMDRARQHLVHSGDVFIVRGNGSKELVGQAGVATECPSGTIFPDLFIRVPLDLERMIPAFFVAWWNSPIMRQRIEAAAKTTSGTWKINQAHIASFPVPVPSVSEQTEALQEIEKHSSRVKGLHCLREKSRLEMTALLPSLLHQAFAGRL